MHDIVLQDAQYCLSTWGRLLQYLAEITAVLGRDYCSTRARLLQYLVQVLRALVVPVDVLFVAIKCHLIGNAHFFQRIEDENLFRG